MGVVSLTWSYWGGCSMRVLCHSLGHTGGGGNMRVLCHSLSQTGEEREREKCFI